PRLHSTDQIKRKVFWIREVMHCLGHTKGRAKLRLDTKGKPDVGRYQSGHAAESFRRNPNNRVRLTVDSKDAADKIVAATISFPKSVARDYNRDGRIWFALLSAKK